MENYKNYLVGILVVGLIVGGAAGFYYGKNKGFAAGVVFGKAQVKAEADAKAKTQADEAAKAANPFTEGVNPFNDININPFK